MEPTAVIALRRYHHDDVTPELKQTLVTVHADAYAEAMDDPFNQRFAWFVDHWSSNPGFACVLGYDGDEPVGFAYGAAAVPQREWWREHWTPDGAAPTSTFALSELMVRPKWRKTGTGRQLHEALLQGRSEALAVLLVDTTHPRVQDLYESWGYRKVGNRQPFADSPLYAVMLKQLQT
ncbi:GNAT family N-acetyltransferase [Streptacidiphilus cavernicola]|uniref:GNAT family N-acetyltransferase n=1 Tax=Streptacidiphilus cavernicola TaxID=3342716 RepID=A0ABV6VVE6_9ACTN